jgi:hypothetical protein
MFIIKLLSQHVSGIIMPFRASLCPSSGEQECALPHMVFCTGCHGCGFVELGRELCAHSSQILMLFKATRKEREIKKERK